MNRALAAVIGGGRVAAVVLACATTIHASEGDFFGRIGSEIREYDDGGNVLQTIPVPYPGTPSCGACEQPRDLVVDPNGDIHVFNGTFEPYLSVYRADSATWQHFTDPDWGTVNNVSYGGIAVLDEFTFVSDNLGADGLFRFDTTDGTAVLFGETFFGYIDVTIGRNGLVYGLEGDQETVQVFDPHSLAQVDELELDKDVRGIAVDESGVVFAASWDGNVYRFAPDGSLELSLPAGAGSLTDVDLGPCGELVIASWSSKILSTDTALTSFTGSFTGGGFVSFADPSKALIAAQEIARSGAVPNPLTLGPGVTGGPVVGQVWDPIITTPAPGSALDILVLSRRDAEIATPVGTLLCDPEGVFRVAVAVSGSPFRIPIPDACGLNGFQFSAQAASFSGSAPSLLTNALDITIGTF